MVFGPSGRHYARHNILRADEPTEGAPSWHPLA